MQQSVPDPRMQISESDRQAESVDDLGEKMPISGRETEREKGRESARTDLNCRPPFLLAFCLKICRVASKCRRESELASSLNLHSIALHHLRPASCLEQDLIRHSKGGRHAWRKTDNSVVLHTRSQTSDENQVTLSFTSDENNTREPV